MESGEHKLLSLLRFESANARIYLIRSTRRVADKSEHRGQLSCAVTHDVYAVPIGK